MKEDSKVLKVQQKKRAAKEAAIAKKKEEKAKRSSFFSFGSKKKEEDDDDDVDDYQEQEEVSHDTFNNYLFTLNLLLILPNRFIPFKQQARELKLSEENMNNYFTLSTAQKSSSNVLIMILKLYQV